jgi:hypothetical protein
MHGDGDFAQLPVVPAGHKKDVETLLQEMLLGLVNEPCSKPAFQSGPEFQAKF